MLSAWKRRRSSRENELAKFEHRVRVVILSDDLSLLQREVYVDEDIFANIPGNNGWRYSIPIPRGHRIRRDSPHILHKMRCGFPSREVAMTLADIEACEMGYELKGPLELPNDIE